MSNIKTHKFSDLYKMSSGISTKPHQAGHGAPFLSFSAVFKDYFLPSELEDLMDTSQKEKEVYSIKKGDVFLTRTSETLDELGMSSVAVKDYPDASYSGFLKRLRPTQDDISYDKYMAFYLRSKLFRKTMTNNAIMTLRASLNEQIFSYLDLLLPPYSEQKKIGDFLYLLNEKIELNNKINSELEAMVKLIYDYWFVQFDFPNENGKPYKSSGGQLVYNEELKRDIPEGWLVKEFGCLADQISDNIDPSQYPELKYLPIDKLPLKKLYYNEYEKRENANSSLIRYLEDDILLGAMRVYFHRVCNAIEDGISRSTMMVIRPFERIHKNYLLFGLNRNEAIEYATINSTGTSIPYAKWNGGLKNYKVSVPNNEDVLKKFNNTANRVLNQFKILTKENQKLSELRDWLLPMLMNGQVTVGSSYVKEEEQLGVAAEPGLVYKNDNTAIDALFESIDHNYEVAVVQLLTDRRFGFTYGKKYTHKMFSNIEMVNTMPKFKDLVFEEKGWGMFSKAIAKTIDAQKFIYFHRLDHGAEVLKVKLAATKEITDWIARQENQDFVSEVNQMLGRYEKPLINREMDRIELLNTVLECMKVLETDNLHAIRKKMANWEMGEDYNKTKAEKFDENVTFHMIQFVKEAL